MSDEAVRKEFEAWAEANGISLSRLRNDFYDGYGSDGTKRAWEAWQASRSAAIQECAAKAKEMSGECWDEFCELAESLLALKER